MLLTLIILSLSLFIGINAVSIKKYGLLSCYSAYGPEWDAERKKYYDINIWSLITVATAFLIVPPMIERGNGNPWQFLGFIAPVYLFLVGLTPHYLTNKIEGIIHRTGAIVSLVVSLIWFVLVLHIWYIPLIMVGIAAILMFITRTLPAWMWWGEIAFYMSVYFALLFC